MAETDQKAENKPKEAEQGFFGNIGSFFKGLVMGPVNAVTGVFKGIWDSTFGNLYGNLLTTAGITAAAYIVPDAIMAVPLDINGKKVGAHMAEDMRDEGLFGVAKDALIASLAVQGAWGAGKGMLGGVGDSMGGPNTSTAEKAGAISGSLAAVAGLGLLAFSQVKSNQIALDSNIAYADNPNAPLPPKTSPQAGHCMG